MKKTTSLCLIAALAAVLCFTVLCTISDDHGNPADPGLKGGGSGTITGGERTQVPTIIVEPNTPPAVAIGVIGVIGVNDSIVVRVTFLSDTTAGAPGLSFQWITVSIDSLARDAGHRLAGTLERSRNIQTDTNGVATIKFYSSPQDTGTVELTFKSLNANPPSSPAVAMIKVTRNPDRNMFINASLTRLKADGAEKSIVTAQVRNKDNNPIVGEAIKFITTAGFVTAEGVTDKDGKATAELTSDRRNIVATVTATLKSDGTKTASIDVEFYGVSMTVQADPQTIMPDTVDVATVTAELRDAAGNAIVGERVTFTKQWGNTRFISVDSITNSSGLVSCKIVVAGNTPNSAELIIARAAGASDEAWITLSDYSIKFTDPELSRDPANPTSMELGGVGSFTPFTITYKQGNGSPVSSGTVVRVTVTLGALDDDPTDPANTIFAQSRTIENNNGTLTFNMANPGFTGLATVYVEGTLGGEDKGFVYFKAKNLDKITLVSTPAVIGINTTPGSTSSYADLVAIAYDVSGNRIKGCAISFNIFAGPGGGEYINPPTAITNERGEARSKLIAGSLPSTFQSVQVRASAIDVPNVRSNTRLTIAGPAKHITVHRNMENISAGPAVYHLDITAIVSDINQNPIPDDVPVSFHTEVIGYRYYMKQARFELDANDKPIVIIDTVSVDVVTEHFRAPRPYRPYPSFNDVDRSGIPITFPGVEAEPCHPRSAPDTVTGNGCMTYANYSGGTYRQRTKSPPPGLSNTDLGLYRLESESAGYRLVPNVPLDSLTYDIDWDRTGVAKPDPNSAVLIGRSIPSLDGMADNKLTYGQSDAGRIRIRMTVECQGLRSPPMEFVLPRSESAKGGMFKSRPNGN